MNTLFGLHYDNLTRVPREPFPCYCVNVEGAIRSLEQHCDGWICNYGRFGYSAKGYLLRGSMLGQHLDPNAHFEAFEPTFARAVVVLLLKMKGVVHDSPGDWGKGPQGVPLSDDKEEGPH